MPQKQTVAGMVDGSNEVLIANRNRKCRSKLDYVLACAFTIVVTCSVFALPVIADDVPITSNSDATTPWPLGEALAIEHTNVLPMTTADAVLRGMTVILEDGRIRAIAPTGDVRLPAGIRRVDGTDKWLMPALTDMHVHVENERLMRLLLGRNDISSGAIDESDIFLPYVANGVLQVLNLGGMSEAIGQRAAIDSGRVLGPHMILAAMIDGAEPIWPVGFTRVAATPADGRQTVRDIQAEGYDIIKTYSGLDQATFVAIVDESQKHGMRVVGHIPGRRTDATEQYLREGFDLVVHAEEFAYQAPDVSQAKENIDRYVALAKQSGTGLISTLSLDQRIAEQMKDFSTLVGRPELKYLHPLTQDLWLEQNGYKNPTPERLAMVETVVEFNRQLVKAFVDGGVPVLPGTDSVVPGVAPGFSIHDEFDALHQAGLSSEYILYADTHLAAQWLGVLADRGTVEVGKRADLLLLHANPTIDISNTRNIAAVISNGRYFSRSQLDTMMSDLAQRYADQLKTASTKASNAPATGNEGGGNAPSK